VTIYYRRPKNPFWGKQDWNLWRKSYSLSPMFLSNKYRNSQ